MAVAGCATPAGTPANTLDMPVTDGPGHPTVAPASPTAGERSADPSAPASDERPDDPTPEAVIDAFHRLAHDPSVTYRADGTAEWTVEGEEIVSSSTVARAADGLHVTSSRGGSLTGEAIVVRGDAAARLAGGEWQPIDPISVTASFDHLSTALVVTDLGAEPDGSGYRLGLEGGFGGFPREAIGIPMEHVTEIVVDSEGRPIVATSRHRRDPTVNVGDDGDAEGVATYTFSDVGEGVTIPPLPIEPTGVAPATPDAATFETVALPSTDLTVGLPADWDTSSDELTLTGADGEQGTVEVKSVFATSPRGGEYEAGTALLPPGLLPGDALLGDVRTAIIARVPSGELRGFRFIEVDRLGGQEFVTDAAAGGGIPTLAVLRRVRIVLADDRLVMLSIEGPPAVVGSAEADRFLASLEVDARR